MSAGYTRRKIRNLARSIRAAAIPPKFKGMLASNKKIKDTWKGKRLDLNDQTRSGDDQSMASQLARPWDMPVTTLAPSYGRCHPAKARMPKRPM